GAQSRVEGNEAFKVIGHVHRKLVVPGVAAVRRRERNSAREPARDRDVARRREIREALETRRGPTRVVDTDRELVGGVVLPACIQVKAKRRGLKLCPTSQLIPLPWTRGRRRACGARLSF